MYYMLYCVSGQFADHSSTSCGMLKLILTFD